MVDSEKPFSEGEVTIDGSTAKHPLGYGVLLFIIINSIIGSSIYYLPQLGYVPSGPATIIAWVILFALASIMMMYVGELITLYPTSGGTYVYCKQAYGRFGSFFAGWLIWIAGNFGMALYVVEAAEYFIPKEYAYYFVLRIIFCLVWILLFNFLAFKGIDAGVTMVVVFGMIATIVVVLMVVPSFVNLPALLQGKFSSPFNLQLMQPFFRQEGWAIFTYLGLSLFLITEAFFGFEAISYMANEAKEPKKLHKVLIGGMVLCGLIMCLYFLSSLGTIGAQDYVNNARPWSVQTLKTMGKFGQTFVVFGMYLAVIGGAAAWPIVGSRLIQAMAKDKLFVNQLAVLHPKHKTPYRAIIFQAVIVSLFSWLIFRGYLLNWGDPYRVIYLIYVLLSLIVLAMILLAVPILRKKEPNLERPFKAPLASVVPVAFVLFFLFLIVNWVWLEGNLAWSILKLAGSFLLLGLPFYFLVEMYYNPEAVVRINEFFSRLTVFTEKIYFSDSLKKEILAGLGDLKGKVVLEYGCGVGTLTKEMAPLVTPAGKIFATDLSLHNVKTVQSRTAGLNQVAVVHHPNLKEFKLDLPVKVDVILSVGMLSYLQEPSTVFSHLAAKIKPKGKILFLDYDKYFYVIPNIPWIENLEQLKAMFAQAGFKVNIIQKKSFLWTYLLIEGERF